MNTINNKQLDSYSMLIVSKYFHEEQDYINVICVNSKFKETTEKLRYNPIPVTSLKLFPKIQTQYLYSKKDIKISEVHLFEVLYEVDYDTYLKIRNDELKCRYVRFGGSDKNKHGNAIPNGVNILAEECYYESDMSNITIPTTVTSIKDECFYGCGHLSTVLIPNSLTKLNKQCFACCKELTSITLPTTLQYVGTYCFEECEKLQTIVIPDSVTSIGFFCFSRCSLLESITLPSSLKELKHETFMNCSSLSTITLPPTLTSIGDSCFEGCSSLTSIKLPLLFTIGRKCFTGCGLHDITIPKQVQSIGFECFSGCTALTNLKLESNDNKFIFKVSYDDSIIYKRFGIDCKNVFLTYDNIEHMVNDVNHLDNFGNFIFPSNITGIDNSTFSYKNDFSSIIIPTTVTSIGDYCFSNSSNLTELSIPTTVQSIGIYSLELCKKLQKLTVPLNENNKYPFKVTYGDYLTLKKFNIDCEGICVFTGRDKFNYKQTPTEVPIQMDMFVYNERNRNAIIAENVVSIKGSFISKTITSITIPTNVTYLCDNLFKGNSKLQSIIIPTTVQYIGKHLIDDCISLTEVKYDGNWSDIVVSYNDYLRYKSNGLIFNSIEYTHDDKIKYGNVIPPIVSSLNSSYYNRPNETIYIPTHITSLGDRMFSPDCGDYGNKVCSELITITIPSSIQTIPRHCFDRCKSLTSVQLPSSLTSIKKKAFYKCLQLKSIVIPSSVLQIDQYAFYKCYSLTSITLPTSSITFGNGCFRKCLALKGDHNIPDHCF